MADDRIPKLTDLAGRNLFAERSTGRPWRDPRFLIAGARRRSQAQPLLAVR